MSYRDKMVYGSLTFFWSTALIGAMGDGGMRIALVISWGLVFVGVVSLFILNDKEIQKMADRRAANNYTQVSGYFELLEVIPLVALMAYFENIWLSGFLLFFGFVNAGNCERVNETFKKGAQ